MASRVVPTPAASPVPLVYLGAAALLFAAALGVSLGFDATMRVDIDGQARRVYQGTTIARLVQEGHLAGHDGNVLSALDGNPVRRGGGASMRLWRNGRPATLSSVVYDGDVIRSQSGTDVVEATVEETLPIPVATRFEGTGPLMTLVSPGSVGAMRVTRGAISRSVIASSVITAAVPMVVERHGARPGDKLVALTFDDGPWPGQTDAVLQILKDNGAKATFFMLGYLVRRNPELARRVGAEGHVIGNHTMGHTMLTKVSPRVVDAQIARGQSVIKKASGVTPGWFRPPGGDISPDVWSRARSASLRIAMWDVDPQDWRRPPAASIAAAVVKRVRPGSIVLLHDGGGDRRATIAALPVIISSLKAKGYRFVTLDELASP